MSVEKVARIQCLDNKDMYMKRDIFLNISELKEGWSKSLFKDKLKDIPGTYTTVREVLYV